MCADGKRPLVDERNACVCIQKISQSKYLRMGGFRCLALAGKVPPALSRSNSANHWRTSVTMGSRRTPSLTRRTRTRSPSKRNSLGRRTAWLRPFLKSFATLDFDIRYSIYLWYRPVQGGLPPLVSRSNLCLSGFVRLTPAALRNREVKNGKSGIG